MSLVFSIGKWGGIYFHIGYTVRVCLGFVAITWLPVDIDLVLEKVANKSDLEEGANNVASI
jgi:hypothetical protein